MQPANRPVKHAEMYGRVGWPLTMALAVVSLIPLAVFLSNPWQPLLEHHAFRQTQTAIAAYWIMHGGAFLRYLTPIVGTPWTLPMELPLFQKLAAELSSHTGLPLDFTGRLLSLTFFYATCAPIFLCLRHYGWPAVAIAIVLLLTGPTGLFFSRAFLIENLATFLSLSALCIYIGFIRTGKPIYLWAFILVGGIAGLQKITTFLPVAVVCGFDSATQQIRSMRHGSQDSLNLYPPASVALAMILPVAWALYSDAVKQEGTLSAFMTSSALQAWNFGTLAQRLDIGCWQQIFFNRILLLGGFVLIPPISLYAAIRKQALLNREALLFLLTGLLGPLMFFNLHFVHDYYQVGILAFLACATAMIISPLLASTARQPPALFAILIAIIAANMGIFYINYSPMLHRVPVQEAISYEVGNFLESHQARDDVTVIVGQDWNSITPYYSQRYALMVPSFLSPTVRSKIINDPGSQIGTRHIGAVVYCLTDNIPFAQAQAESIRLFSLIDGPMVNIAHCRIKYRQPRSHI